jgi:murein DD-endopeptidase MepM/ murein hydrolase activator NlpD
MLLLAATAGCGGGDGGSEGGSDAFNGPPLADVTDPQPSASNTLMPLFSRPFTGEYQVLNYFDHDVPTWPERTNGYKVTWRGARATPGKDIRGYDGHTGIDWLLPENTPLFAVTGGEVVFAGPNSFACPLQNNEVVTQLTVRFRFIAPSGDTYTVTYTHLNRIDVAVGDLVSEGQQLGLSGATGCLGQGQIPHLHFQIVRNVSLNPPQDYFVDPYGWEGPGVDPWSARGAGRTSAWLWKPGQAPDMVPWRVQ